MEISGGPVAPDLIGAGRWEADGKEAAWPAPIPLGGQRQGSEELGQGTRSRRHQRGVREDRSLEKDRERSFSLLTTQW